MFTLITQVLLNGVISGLIAALTAAGFSLIYGNANILFFAIGDIYMLGAIFFYFFVANLGLPYFGALIAVLVILGLVGVAVEWGLYRHLRGNELTFAFASLALGMLIAGVALEYFGEQGRGLPNPFRGALRCFGVAVTLDKIAVVMVTMVILMGFHLFFRFTKTGWAIRAVTQDLEAAKLMGVDTNRLKSLIFFLAFAVAGMAGALVAPLYYVDVFMGAQVLMTTLTVVVLGGLGSFPGAIMGGILIGLLESFGYTFLGGITTVITFIAVIGLLIFRPQGLLGSK
jgi:branched-chain amino acid transport system permease protein